MDGPYALQSEQHGRAMGLGVLRRGGEVCNEYTRVNRHYWNQWHWQEERLVPSLPVCLLHGAHVWAGMCAFGQQRCGQGVEERSCGRVRAMIVSRHRFAQ